MKLGIVAGNRLLPVILVKEIKKKIKGVELVVIAFKGETSSQISRYADRIYWIPVGSLSVLRDIIKKEAFSNWIMAGQISPVRIFERKHWDKELSLLADKIKDFCPHTIFANIISYLGKEKVEFLDSTLYLKDSLADKGVMNNLSLNEDLERDIDFGEGVISRYVELDVGQTIVVKNRSVVALESLEGTDRTILRAYRLAGKGCVVFKFSKVNQDLRFDVPVVGISTLRLLKRIKAAALVLERGKVLILEKDKFLLLARQWQIPVIGKDRR